MSVSNFFTKTATVKRLGTTDKTKKTYATLSTVNVSEPQISYEADAIQGAFGQYTNIFCAITEDISQNDQLVIDSKVYTVLEVMNYEIRNIKYKDIKAILSK